MSNEYKDNTNEIWLAVQGGIAKKYKPDIIFFPVGDSRWRFRHAGETRSYEARNGQAWPIADDAWAALVPA